MPGAQLIIALALEERFSPRQCYTYNMATAYFGHHTTGVTEAALRFYNKKVSQLTEREILALNLIRNGAGLLQSAPP